MSDTPFLQPELNGKRFDSHSIPLDFLPDLAVLQDILIDIAKAEFKRANPNRKRIPKNFSGGLEIGLSKVDDGSAKPLLNFIFAGLALIPNHPVIPYLEKARDTLINAVAVIAAGSDIPDTIPKSSIKFFSRFGQNLKDDESIGFTDGQNKIKYTKTVREKIIAQSQCEPVKQTVFYRGFVSEIDREKMTWTFLSIDRTKRITVPLLISIEDTVHQAQRNYNSNSNNNVKISLSGEVVVNPADMQMETVEDVSILDPLDIGAQLEEFKLLKQGWLDGEQGNSFNAAQLDGLIDAFDWHYPETLPLPYLFPTPSGEVQAEWKFNNYNVILIIDTQQQTGHCYIMDMKTGIDDGNDKEFVINVSNPDDWDTLSKHLQPLYSTPPQT